MIGDDAATVVATFWSLMESNDFRSVGAVLSDDFVLDWPQSGERIRGRNNFAAMNEAYPAHGRWHFTVNAIIGTVTTRSAMSRSRMAPAWTGRYRSSRSAKG